MKRKFRIEKLDSNLLRMQRFDCTSDCFVVIEASDRFLCKRKWCRFIPAFDWTESRDRVSLASIDNEKLHWKLRDIFGSVISYRKILPIALRILSANWIYNRTINYEGQNRESARGRKLTYRFRQTHCRSHAFRRIVKQSEGLKPRYPWEGLKYFSIRTRGCSS